MYSFDYTNYNIFKIILKQDYFCINLGQVKVKGLQIEIFDNGQSSYFLSAGAAQ